MALAPAQRDKLARILALLASDQPGEVVAAAHAANRLVKSAGLSWVDVLAVPRLEAPVSTPGWTPSPSPVPNHGEDLQTCGRRLDLLTPWEREFVANLAWPRAKVSQKQRNILAAIAAKVRAAGPRAG